jgi:hypothetical protein
VGEIEQNIERYEREIDILKKKKVGVDIELKRKKAAFDAETKKMIEIDNKIIGLEELIKSLKPRNIRISTHALLRYVERILKIDLEEIKRKIINKDIEQSYYQLGDGKYHNGNITLLINNDTVVTITNKEDL